MNSIRHLKREGPARLHQPWVKRAPASPKAKANPKEEATTTAAAPIAAAVTTTTTTATIVATGRTGAAFTGSTKSIADSPPTSAKALVTTGIEAYNTLYTTVANVNTAYVPPNSNGASSSASAVGPNTSMTSSATSTASSTSPSSSASDANTTTTDATTTKSDGIKLTRTDLIAIIAGGGALLIVLIVLVSVCCYKRKKAKKASKQFWSIHGDPKARDSMPIGGKATRIPDQTPLGSKWTTKKGTTPDSGNQDDDEKTWGTRAAQLRSGGLEREPSYASTDENRIGRPAEQLRQPQDRYYSYGGVAGGNSWQDRDSLNPHGMNTSSSYDLHGHNRAELLGPSSHRSNNSFSPSLNQTGIADEIINFHSPRQPPAAALPLQPLPTASSGSLGHYTGSSSPTQQYPPSRLSQLTEAHDQQAYAGTENRSTASILGTSMLGMMTGADQYDASMQSHRFTNNGSSPLGHQLGGIHHGNGADDDGDDEERIISPKLPSSNQQEAYEDADESKSAEWGPLTNTLLPTPSAAASSSEQYNNNKTFSRVDSKPLRELEDILHSFSNTGHPSSSSSSRHTSVSNWSLGPSSAHSGGAVSGAPMTTAPLRVASRAVNKGGYDKSGSKSQISPSSSNQSFQPDSQATQRGGSANTSQWQSNMYQQTYHPLDSSNAGSSSSAVSRQPESTATLQQGGRRVSLATGGMGDFGRLDRKDSMKANIRSEHPQQPTANQSAAEAARLKDIFRQTMLDSDRAGGDDHRSNSSGGPSEPDWDRSFGSTSNGSSVATHSPTTPKDWNSSSQFLPQLPVPATYNDSSKRFNTNSGGGGGVQLQGKGMQMTAFPTLSEMSKDPMTMNYRSATESIYQMYD